MRILHLCLSCFYIDNFSYQENELTRQNKLDGHTVEIIASTEKLMNDSTFYPVGEYYNEDGIMVKRIPYRKLFGKKIMKKIRAYQNVINEIESFKPDVIMFHGLAAYEIITVAKYKKKHPNVYFIADSHEDFYNSGRNFLSRYILHGMFYKLCLKKAYSAIDTVWCYSWDSMDFVEKVYGIHDKLVWQPLGGQIISDEEYASFRSEIRDKYSFNEDDIVFIHTGKIQKRKRIPELMNAFASINREHIYLILAGRFEDVDLEREIRPYFEKENIIFVDWLDPKTLRKYLCASDVYIQLGTQSATVQNAVCCKCTYMLYPHKSYVKMFGENSGYYVRNEEEIKECINTIAKNPMDISVKRSNAFKVAQEVLDYKKQAKDMYKAEKKNGERLENED